MALTERLFCRAPSAGGPLRRALIVVGLAALVAMTLSSASPNADAAAKASVAHAATPCGAVRKQASSVSFPSPNWRVCVGSTITQSSPSVAEVDGTTVIAIGDESGVLHLLNAATGSEMPGWPQRVQTASGKSAAIESSPTFVYFDGPNKPPSIVVGTGSTWVGKSVGEVEAFRFNGTKRFVFHVGVARGTAAGVISTPAAGNLTGNGQQDIVFGSWDHNIYALTPAGHLVRGFPINNADTVWSSPSLSRRRGSRGEDIYIGSDASGLHGCYGGWVSDYRYAKGAPRLVWQHCEAQSIWSSPAIADFGGRAAVVVGTSFYEQPFPSATDKIYAFYANNGAPVPGWPVTTPGPVLGSPAIGAINSSGQQAIVDTSWVCTGPSPADCSAGYHSAVSAFSEAGQRLWQDDLPGPTAFSSPVLTPLRGEDYNDVVVGTSNGLYTLSGSNGAFLFGTSPSNRLAAINPECPVYNAPAIAPVTIAGGTTSWRVIEACGGPPALKVPGEVVSYVLPSTPSDPSWPMFHDNAQHTGLAPAS